MMHSEVKVNEIRAAVDAEMKQVVDDCIPGEYGGMRPLLAYHLGWEGEGAGVEAQGKRVRPTLVCLCAAAAGGNWKLALPAAAAVELIHNFSLVHDDIQDQSPLRRGRQTVWVKWGTPQAINAGDLLFTLAFSALGRLRAQFSSEMVLEAQQVLQTTCIYLTGGQYLDLAYESQRTLPAEAYWPMIGGKTAALLACCAELGALTALAGAEQRRKFHEFGQKLGMAFQVQDDWLGIWGDAARTGKSTASDLVSGKKTLPVVFALQKRAAFAERWLRGPLEPQEVAQMARLLEEEGARHFTEETADRLTQEAMHALEQTGGDVDGTRALLHLAEILLRREN